MLWLTGTTGVLLMTLCILMSQNTDTLEITSLNTKRNISPAKGSSAKLSCKAHYNSLDCGLVHVIWHNVTTQSTVLNDTTKFLTTVNETVFDNVTHRQVVTEILNVTPADNGDFQCKAQCNKSGEAAIGHIMRITVKD